MPRVLFSNEEMAKLLSGECISLSISNVRLLEFLQVIPNSLPSIREVTVQHLDLQNFRLPLEKLNNTRKLELKNVAHGVLANIAHCPHLRQLVFRGLRQTKLPPQLAHCRNLTSIILESTNIAEIPSSYKNLIHLTSFESSCNPKLTTMPDTCGEWQKLQVLTLEDNGFRHLPSCVTEFKDLEVLNLRGNPLEELSSPFHFPNLKKLVLSRTKLSQIPPDIGYSKQLLSLDLQDSNITELPPVFYHSCRSLRILTLGRAFCALPPDIECLTNLSFLDGRHSQITFLPVEVTRLPYLAVLDMESSLLKDVASNWTDCSRLREINILKTPFNEDWKTRKALFPLRITLLEEKGLKFLSKGEFKVIAQSSEDYWWQQNVERLEAQGLVFPQQYKCSICYSVMKSPRVTCYGHSYCKKCITTWFHDHDTEPLTNKKVWTKDLYPNHFIMSEITTFFEQHKEHVFPEKKKV